jgi:hypothetical protein
MKFDELMAAMPNRCETPEQIAAVASMLCDCTDLSDDEKFGFLTGLTMGMAYMLSMCQEGKSEQAAQFLAEQLKEMDARLA